MSDILTLAQAAALLQCSAETLRQRAARGEIPERRLGGWRFSRNAMLDTIYQLQTDLKLLAEQLARDRNPDVNDWAMMDLVTLSHRLHVHHPSMSRH